MWYYVLNGQQQGPLSREALSQKLATELSPDTLIWKEGMSDWLKASEVDEFKSASSAKVSPSTHVSPSAEAAPNNPYASPTVANVQHTISEEYPLPPVKRANFSLLLMATLLGFAGLIACCIIFFANIATDINTTYAEVSNSGSTHYYSSGGTMDDLSAIFTPTLIIVLSVTIVVFLWSAILGLTYVYRAWKLIQPAGASTTPGKAVGFLFIPLFNYYWTFIAYWKWAQEWNATCTQYRSLQSAPRGSEGSFLAMAICQCVSIVFNLAGLGYIVLYLVGMKSMCDVINFAADRSTSESV